MKKVPNMISTKDLSYLEDMFNWHFIICKKGHTYMTIIEDATLSDFMKDVYKKHKKICEKILKILD